MKRKPATLIVAAIIGGPASGEGTMAYGVAVVSDYVSDAETQASGDPAIQPYVEYEFGSGIYAGVWASNVDFGGADQIELDLSLGYRTEVGAVALDVGYFRYYYDDAGFDSEDLMVSVGYSLSDLVWMNTGFVSDLDGGLGLTQGAAFDLGSGYELSGELSLTGGSSDRDWNIGITKALSDTVALDLWYHDANTVSDTIFAVGLSFDTSIGGSVMEKI